MVGENEDPRKDLERVLKEMVPGHSDDWYEAIVRRQMAELRYYWFTYRDSMETFMRGGSFRLPEEYHES